MHFWVHLTTCFYLTSICGIFSSIHLFIWFLLFFLCYFLSTTIASTCFLLLLFIGYVVSIANNPHSLSFGQATASTTTAHSWQSNRISQFIKFICENGNAKRLTQPRQTTSLDTFSWLASWKQMNGRLVGMALVATLSAFECMLTNYYCFFPSSFRNW